MIPEYRDFNMDGYIGYNPTQPVSECNNSYNKISNSRELKNTH